MKNRVSLAIRHKIIIAFALLLIAGLSLSFVVYQRQTTLIQEKMNFIQNIDDIRENILEIRRYEKNFFLFHSLENLREVENYVRQTVHTLKQFVPATGSKLEPRSLKHLEDLLSDYGDAIARLQQAADSQPGVGESDTLNQLSDLVRQIGKDMTELIIRIVNQEREYIHLLLKEQKTFFFYYKASYLVLICVVSLYLFLQVILPLSRIEKAAAAISKGDLHRIPHIRGSLAIHSLVATINRMIEELNKKSEQLIQQEKMASLGTLTSGVAHELNNPLSNISSSTQILLEELGQNDLDFQQKMMRGIEEQVEKARDIVRSLLEFARENEFRPVATDVRQLIEKTIKLVHSEIPADVSIEVDIAEGVVAQLDTRRMSQALINLLMNAIQSMEGCGGQVTVRALLNSDQHQLIIEVADEGCGIDAKTIPRVFDPFFSTKDVDRGTGLGLYVTYGIIKKHNGDITVSSQSGSGTKFVITLPTEQPSETL